MAAAVVAAKKKKEENAPDPLILEDAHRQGKKKEVESGIEQIEYLPPDVHIFQGMLKKQTSKHKWREALEVILTSSALYFVERVADDYAAVLSPERRARKGETQHSFLKKQNSFERAKSSAKPGAENRMNFLASRPPSNPPETTQKGCDYKILYSVPVDEISYDCLGSVDKQSKQNRASIIGKRSSGSGLKQLDSRSRTSSAQDLSQELHGEGEDDDHLVDKRFTLTTSGESAARLIVLKVADDKTASEWLEHIHKAKQQHEAEELQAEDFITRMRHIVRMVYDTDLVQAIAALLILTNFALNIAEAEMTLDEDSRLQKTFNLLDIIFTGIFCFELIVNMFGHHFRIFITDGWNQMDVIVISISVISFAFPSLSDLNTLRVMRAFRVLRIFKRLSSLRMIIDSLIASVFPVLNAVAVVVLVTCVYAILGVNFFQNSSSRFASFSSALFTMFQTITGDSWTSLVADLSRDSQWEYASGPAAFFASYIIFVGWILFNVVVAVMLEEFIDSNQRIKELNSRQKVGGARSDQGWLFTPLDPVMEILVTEARNNVELVHMLHRMFLIIDLDKSHSVSFEEVYYGFKRILIQNFDEKVLKGLIPPEQDPPRLMLNELKELLLGKEENDISYSWEQFKHMMVSQLEDYIQCLLHSDLRYSALTDGKKMASLASLKLLCMETVRCPRSRSLAEDEASSPEKLDTMRSDHKQGAGRMACGICFGCGTSSPEVSELKESVTKLDEMMRQSMAIQRVILQGLQKQGALEGVDVSKLLQTASVSEGEKSKDFSENRAKKQLYLGADEDDVLQPLQTGTPGAIEEGEAGKGKGKSRKDKATDQTANEENDPAHVANGTNTIEAEPQKEAAQTKGRRGRRNRVANQPGQEENPAPSDANAPAERQEAGETAQVSAEGETAVSEGDTQGKEEQQSEQINGVAKVGRRRRKTASAQENG